VTQPSPPLPIPPVPVPPPPEPPVANTQPNPVKSPAPDSKELLNTLMKLRAQAQKEPPKALPNPQRGGKPNGGGNPKGSDTNLLTPDQRAAIGNEVRRCWTYDAGAKGVNQMRVLLDVTTDADGMARIAKVAPEDQGALNDPVFRAFAERAVRAVLDPVCSKLPLPPDMLGQTRQWKFRFSP
jgi:outer membrane biosynthesis protein TonB